MHVLLEFVAYGVLTITACPLVTGHGELWDWAKFIAYAVLLAAAALVWRRVQPNRITGRRVSAPISKLRSRTSRRASSSDVRDASDLP